MFAHRQQLDVGETHVQHIRHERIGKLVPGQPAVAVLRLAAPRCGMHFVDAHRRVQCIGLAARLASRHPRWQAGHDAGRGRAQLRLQGIGVGTQRQLPALRVQQFELVAGTGADCGQKELPYATFAAQPHGMAPAIPEVEIADHADAAGVGCPDREPGALDSIQTHGLRAHHLAGAQMGAVSQQPQVGVAYGRTKAVRVFQHRFAAVAPAHLQLVGRLQPSTQHALEETIGMALRQSRQHPPVTSRDHQHLLGTGQEGTHRRATIAHAVRSQHRKRVAMAASADQRDVIGVDHGPVQPGAGMAGTCQMLAA